jgi:hypothetical protein
MILRGFSFFLSIFPATQGKTSGPMAYFYYVLAYVLLFVFGYAFQKKRGYDSENQDDKEDQGSLEGDADDQFERQKEALIGTKPNPTIQQ